MKLKICGMKYPLNIEEVLMVKPDYLGFIFYTKSPRYIDSLSPEWLKSLTNIQKVGVFVNDQPNIIAQQVRDYGLNMVQLHGHETPKMVSELKHLGITVIKAFGIDAHIDWGQLTDFEDLVDYFLFDTKSTVYGGTGKLFDWKLLEGYSLTKPYFLSGGIGVDQIQEVFQLQDDRLFALDVNSRFESAPGLKNITLLQSAFGQK